MQKINEIQDSIIKEFDLFDNWMQKYEYLIDLGKELAPIEKKHKCDENLIKGCQSRVWLHAEIQNKKIKYLADSDTIMTKGIIALLIKVFSNQKASEISKTKLYFVEKIGLKDQLSATRANGLLSMIKQMKLYALGLENL